MSSAAYAQQAGLSVADRELQRTIAGVWFAEDPIENRWNGEFYSYERGGKASCRSCCSAAYTYNARIELAPKLGPDGGLLKGRSTTIARVTRRAGIDWDGADYDARGRRNLQAAIDDGRIALTCPPDPDPALMNDTSDIVVAASGALGSRVLTITFFGATHFKAWSLKLLSDDAMERNDGQHKRLYRKQL